MKSSKTRVCWLLLVTSLFFTLSSFGQTISLTGKVVDSSGKALEGVSVLVKGHKKATATDAMGAFNLAIPAARATLVISAVGFASKEVAVTAEQHTVTIALNRSADAMQDVVIVGYMQQSRKNVTAAVSKLDMAEMKDVSSPNPVLALQGKLPGVSVPVSSGQPGASPVNIIIRGGTRLNVYGTGIGNSGGNAIGSSTRRSCLGMRSLFQ